MAKHGKDKPTGSDGHIIAANKKARRDYEILATFEAGLVLVGSEVKSVRKGGTNLSDSYVKVKNGELFLINCHIAPYSHAPADSHLLTRERKLLLHRKEIEKLAIQISQKGLTIVPLDLHFKNSRCKALLGVGRGKKHYDKREDLKKREADRQIARAMKQQ